MNKFSAFLTAIVSVASLQFSGALLAEPIDGGWFTQILWQECGPPVAPDTRFNCSGRVRTDLALENDFDAAIDGSAANTFVSPDLENQSAISVGYSGPGAAPTLSGYAYPGNGYRFNTSGFGFQRYTFLEDGTLNVSATLTYSYSGAGSSRDPYGWLDGGITAFQMDDDQFDPEDCNLFVQNAYSDLSSPGAGYALLFCLLNNGKTLYDGTIVEFTGLENFENHEFLPPFTPVQDGEIVIDFSIEGQAGDVWFITGDLFLFAHNAGWADSRNTLVVAIENPEIVEPTLPVDTFVPSPPLTIAGGIDIKPHAWRNNIDVISPDSVAVGILGSGDFDTTMVVVNSLRFGPGEAQPTDWRPQFRDINFDGYPDLVVRFPIADIGLVCGDTSAQLNGLVQVDVPFTATDSVITVNCP